MSIYTPPTLPVIRDRISAEFGTRLSDPLQTVRGSLPYALVYALSGLEYGLHQGLSYLADQLMPQTCGDYQLRRWADLLGLTPQTATQASSSAVVFTGTNGTVIPAGTTVARFDGWQYATDDEQTVDISGTATAACTSVEPGADGNAGLITVTLTSPISGIGATATASAAFIGGLDDEPTEALRIRVLDALRAPTAGGRSSDYDQWVRAAVSNVDVVWTRQLNTTSNVLYIGFLLAEDGADCIPSSGDVISAQTYIDGQRPVTAFPIVFQPTATTLDLDLELTNDTNEQRAAVEAALHKFLRQASSVRDTDGTATILNSQIHAAISSVTSSYVLSSVDGGAATDDFPLGDGHVAILGTVTWL